MWKRFGDSLNFTTVDSSPFMVGQTFPKSLFRSSYLNRSISSLCKTILPLTLLPLKQFEGFLLIPLSIPETLLFVYLSSSSRR